MCQFFLDEIFGKQACSRKLATNLQDTFPENILSPQPESGNMNSTSGTHHFDPLVQIWEHHAINLTLAPTLSQGGKNSFFS